MKTTTLILVLVCCWNWNARAQGVLLGPGDTLEIGFNGVERCQFTEFAFPGGGFSVFFGNNRLDPGESLQLEIFENGFNESAATNNLYAPVTSVSTVGLYSLGSWQDYQGVVRVSLVSGSVEVDRLSFVVAPNHNTLCFSTVIVPEPKVFTFSLLGSIIGVVLLACRRRNVNV